MTIMPDSPNKQRGMVLVYMGVMDVMGNDVRHPRYSAVIIDEQILRDIDDVVLI